MQAEIRAPSQTLDSATFEVKGQNLSFASASPADSLDG